MEFSPNQPVVQRCLQAMRKEDEGQPEAAASLFLQAWEEAGNAYEKFMTAWFVARHQNSVNDKLHWLKTALHFALEAPTDLVKSAYPFLYKQLAHCHDALQHTEQANNYHALAEQVDGSITDSGPFYHGTKAALQTGDLLTAGGVSNYQAGLTMNHIYFTALPHGASLAAAMAKGEGPGRIYQVAPTGPFENDPNVTNKKFPGNPTRSYRSENPLKIIAEITSTSTLSVTDRQTWKDKLANNKGEIIN